MEKQALNESILTSDEKKVLRRQLVPSILLSVGLITVITLVNLAMHYMDVLTGINGVGRPPVSRLWIIELIAVLIGTFTFLYLTKKVRKDLLSGKKIITTFLVKRKYSKKENGTVNLKLILSPNLTVDVSNGTYASIGEGDLVEVARTAYSEHVFRVNKVS
jgi:fumarate reductase subunit C